MYSRDEEKAILEYMGYFPVTAILGARQCGKTTLAKGIAGKFENSIYLDMEKQSDFNKISSPELFFENNAGKLIVIDEIQLRDGLFKALRSFVDTAKEKTPILILGSASPKLIRQSSETLAGRIAFCELSPLNCREIDDKTVTEIWTRGGFPGSIAAPSDILSRRWREFYIKTFVERDLPQLGLRLPVPQINRLFMLLANSHAEILNSNKLGEALGVSHTAFRQYIDFLENAFLVRTLKPYFNNVKKRVVKSPKIYIRDSGLLHSILNIRNFNDLLGNPFLGNSWEGFAIEQVLSGINKSDWNASFYRTQAGAELDLVLENQSHKIGMEFKANVAPSVTRGFWNSCGDLQITKAFIVCPIEDSYPLKGGVTVCGLRQVIVELGKTGTPEKPKI
ncbi:MAG: ATP-binding protein [Chitinispirillales bacterium]|jgi:predicted AAA+ superfamily ATPase|nr:ATP-binding protein [Chitinispirillales bacterium]